MDARADVLDMGDTADDSDVRAAYVLAARLRLDPGGDVSIEPPTVDVTVRRAAPPPGEAGWLYFRDNCWRGDLNDPGHVASRLAEEVSVRVESVTFRELRTTSAYYDALREAIAGDLDAFNAEDVDPVVKKYLGSSVHVVEPADLESTGQ